MTTLAHLGGPIFAPAQIVLPIVFGLLYTRRVRTLARTPRAVPGKRQACFMGGLALIVVTLTSPIGHVSDELFWVHMAEHLLIADLGALLIVMGLTGPLLAPALRIRWLSWLRAFTHPLVALPLWAVDICLWHVTPLYDAALDHDAVHALQHTLFFLCGALLWASLLELLPGPRWFRLPHRLAYVGVMWIVSLTLSQIFIWSGHAYYARYGGDVGDQRVGGGIMLLEGSVVMVSVLAWLLWRELSPSMSTASVAQPNPVAPQGVPSSGS